MRKKVFVFAVLAAGVSVGKASFIAEGKEENSCFDGGPGKTHVLFLNLPEDGKFKIFEQHEKISVQDLDHEPERGVMLTPQEPEPLPMDQD
jgi:hypothetical protein